MSINVEFPQTDERYDPYKNFKFRVKWNGKYVAGVSKVTTLKRATEVISHRPGEELTRVRRIPGQTAFDAITLERGVTHDQEFQQWANRIWDYRNSSANSQQGGSENQGVLVDDFRKDLTLEVYNEAGEKVLAYNVRRCWPSEFRALPELDANGDAIAIQSLVLENEGWERDPSVQDPTGGSFTLPADKS